MLSSASSLRLSSVSSNVIHAPIPVVWRLITPPALPINFNLRLRSSPPCDRPSTSEVFRSQWEHWGGRLHVLSGVLVNIPCVGSMPTVRMTAVFYIDLRSSALISTRAPRSIICALCGISALRELTIVCNLGQGQARTS